MARDFHLSVSADFIGHVKTRKLVRLLGGDESAPLRLIQFWSWAAEFAPNGDLSEIDAPEIEYGAGHKGPDGQLLKALVAAGFVDETPAGHRIHNWMLPGRTGFALEAMEKSRARWRRSKGIKTRADEDVTEDSARSPAVVNEDSSVLHGSRFTVHGSSEENSPPAPAIPGGTPPVLWSANDWLARFRTAFQDANKGIFYGRGAGDGKALGTLQASLDALPAEGRIAAQLRAPLIFAEFMGDRSPKAVAEKYQFSYFVLLFNGLRTPAKEAAARAGPGPRPPSTATRDAFASLLSQGKP